MMAGIWIVLSPWLINVLGVNSTWSVIVAGAVVVVASVWFLFKAGIFRLKKLREKRKSLWHHKRRR